MKLQKLLLPLFVFLVFSLKASITNTTTFATVKIYVNANISNQGNGTSWNTAFISLDEAITEAKNLLANNTEVHIWVQKGNYKTTATSLPNNLHIYGGFNGSETNLSERTNYVTTLSNATIISPLTTNTGLFTIAAATNIKINGIVFKDLEDTNGSSTILKVNNTSSNIHIEHCLFDNNKNFSGGAALQILNSVVKVSFTKFSNNTVLGDNNAGGAVQINSSTVEFYTSTFSRNSSELDYGGALYATGNSANLTFNYSNFIANKAQKGASAIYFDELSGTANFFRSVVSFNRSEQESTDKFGALHASGSTNGLTVNLESNYTVFSDNWKKTGSSYVYSASVSSTNATITNVDNPTIDSKKSSSSQSESYFDTQDKKETRQMLLKPLLTSGDPEIGKERKVQFSEFNGTSVYHTIYLPENWDATKKHPVLVDISGNPFNHNWGDYSTGKTESSYYGYAISNKNAITVTVPMINQNGDAHTSQLGDVQKTIAYIKKVMVSIVEDWGGDPARILLGGYSRGGVGTSFLGKYDDEIADIWLGWYHYDGYDYPYGPTINLREFTYNTTNDDWDVDGGIARRFARTKGRSTLIAGSGYSNAFQIYNANYNFPFEFFGTSSEGRNHNPIWALGDNPISKKARDWFSETITELTGTVSFSGKIISLDTGLPIENVKVSGGITRWDVTNSNGSFSFEGLPKGTRTFVLTLPNNKEITKEIEITTDLNQDIKVCENDLDTCYTNGIKLETLEDFHYKILNKSNGKAIKTNGPDSSISDNTGITIFTNSSDENQKIKFVKTLNDDEFYMISNEDKYITALNLNNETKVTLQTNINTANENFYKWKVIESNEEGYYFIKNVGSSTFIKSLISSSDNSLLEIASLEINDELKWKLDLKGSIDFTCNIMVNDISENVCSKELIEGDTVQLSVLPNKVGSWSWVGPNNFAANTRIITLSNIDATKSGAYTVSYTTEANTNIKKELELRVISYHIPALSTEGFYRFTNKANTKSIRGYDANTGSPYFGYADNAGITIYTDNTVWGSLRYNFHETENENEFYITNVGSGAKYITSLDPTNNDKVTLQSTIIENLEDNFLWLIEKTNTAGIYLIKNKATDTYLKSDSNTSNNNYIKLQDYVNNDEIKWNLQPTVTALKCSTIINDKEENECNSTISVGSNLTLAPKPNVHTGQWTWSGPNGFSTNERTITLENISKYMFGTYTVTYSPNSSKKHTSSHKNNDVLSLDFTVSDNALNTDSFSLKDSILIYPNPVNDILYIDLREYSNEEIQIRLFTMLGKEIMNFNAKKASINIIKKDINNSLKKGLYFIQIIIGREKTYQQKLIMN